MNSFKINELKAMINRSLDDTACPYIRKGVLAGGGQDCWYNILCALEMWQSEGILEIIKNPEHAENGEVCVIMKKYINQKSSIPGFLNYDNSQ